MAKTIPMAYGHKSPEEVWKLHLASVDAWKDAIAARHSDGHSALALKAARSDIAVFNALFPPVGS